MDKLLIRQRVLEQLAHDLQHAEQAARQAHETATHEENVAENKYDTLGLEAAYLATGHARRADAIRHAIANWQAFKPRAFDPDQGIEIGALIWLAAADAQQRVFLGPDGGSMSIKVGDDTVQVITRDTPLARALMGQFEGDEVAIHIDQHKQLFEVLKVH